MSDWKEYRLGDICEVFGRIGFRGYTSKDLVETYEDGAISLSPSNIVQGEIELSKCTYIKWDKYEESPEIKIQVGDIIFVKTGSSYGRSALIRSVEHPMTLNPQLVVLKNIKVNPIILSYVIKGREFQGKVYGIIGGSAIPTLSQKRLAELTIKLPSKERQDRISDILLSIDSKISVNRRICENLEAQAQALFKHWFIDFAQFKDGKFVESELGMIPEGWRVGRLGEIAEFKRGRTITKSDTIEGEIPVVAGGLEPAYYHNKSNTSSRVITVSGSGANAGFTRLYFQPVWASDCSFVDNESTSYLHTAFCFLLVYKKKVDALKWGAAQPHVYAKDINKLSFAIPQIDVLSHFEELVTPFFDYMEKCKRESSRLSTLRDTLLPRLMSGEIKL